MRALHNVALSMRPLAEGDWESIAAPEYTALINDLTVDQTMGRAKR